MDIGEVKAKDIMTKEVVCARRGMPIYEAVELMRRKRVAGIPIVEDDMVLVGVLTEKDVLRLLYEDAEAENKTVDDYMSRPAVAFDEEDGLESICDFMMVNHVRRVPVKTGEGKVVGIISRPDVIDYILRSRRGGVGVNA
jgi:CBS domain-containing membrane protein